METKKMKKSDESDVPSSFAFEIAKNPWRLTHSKVNALPSKLFATNFANIISNKNNVLIIDGIVTSRNTYLSLSRNQINQAIKKCKIKKVIEKIYINQFGVPLVVHRIIGGDVYNFAKYVGISVISTEQNKQMEIVLNYCGFAFAGENVIFEE